MALNPMDRVVRDISDIKRQLAGRSQLNHSSLENTSIPVYDGDGTERLRIGAQDDGTHSVKYVQGPPPPRPTAPVVSVDGPVVRVRWDGILTGGHIPEDFARIDVHFALATDDLEDPAAVRGNLATSAGNETVLAATQTGTYRVGLVAMSQSRARSEMSEVTEVEVELVNLKGAIDTAVDNASGGSNHYRPAPPEGTDHTENDLWFDTSVDPETGLTAYTPHRWDETAQDWVSVGDQRTAAIQDAVAGLESALDDIVVDSSGTKNFYQTEPPKLTDDPAPAEGDLWFDQNDQNKPYIFRDGGWVSIRDDSFLSTARNLMPWAASQAAPPNPHAINGQTSTVEGLRMELQAGLLDPVPDIEMYGIKYDGERDAARVARVLMPFQGVLDGTSGTLLPDSSLTPHEFRPIGFTLGLLARSDGGLPDAVVKATFFDVEGNEVGSLRSLTYAKDISDDDPFKLAADLYGYNRIIRADDVLAGQHIDPSAVSFGLHVEISLPRIPDSRILPLEFEARVQVPENGIAADAITEAKLAAEAVTETKIAPDSISSPKIIAGAIQTAHLLAEAVTAEKMAVGTITADSGIIGSLNAGVITAGEMDGARIKAGSIAASTVAVGDFTNLATIDPVRGVNVSRPPQWATVTEGAYTRPAPGTQNYLMFKDRTDTVPFRGGDKLRATFRVVSAAAGTARVRLWAYEQPAEGTNANAWAESETVSLGATEQTVSVAISIPDGFGGSLEALRSWTMGLVPLSGTDMHGVRVRDVAVYRMMGATLIQDGAITTEKIAVGAITAESGIIGSLDAGVINVGEMNGARIEAGTVDTEQLAFGAATGDVLSIDALNFKTAVGLDIRGSSFRAGDAVEMTEDFGIRQFGPDGALNVSLPSDGSPAEFRGDLSARTLTATGRMSIQGPGAIASGGVLELESGVVPPVAGPQITNVWDRTTFPPLTDQEAPAGLAWADGHFWRCVTTSVGLSEGGRTRIEKISPTGELVGGWDTTFRVSVNGITILNGELYVLAARLSVSGDDSTPVRPRMVVVYDLNGVEKRRWEYPNYGTGTFQPGIGNDGLNIVIAQSWANGDHTYRTFNRTTGALVRQYDTGFKMQSNVTQILFGDFDYGDGRKKIIAQQRADLKAFVCYDSAETAPHDVARSWNAADFQNPIGLAWDGARFHSLTPAGDLVSYQSHETNRIIGDDEDDWWGAVTWATGSQETTAGPATRFRYLHRAQLRVQNGDVPAGVEAARFYTSKGTAEPGRTALRWRFTSEHPHEPLRVTSISSYSTGSNPPATNTFTADTPGEIHSVLGNFRVDGSGAGEWGPLEFHPDGSMTGIPKFAHGAVVVTPVADIATSMEVTLPVGRFSSPPTVVVSLQTGNLTNARNVGVNFQRTTKDSFEVVLLRANAVGTSVNWIAIGE